MRRSRVGAVRAGATAGALNRRGSTSSRSVVRTPGRPTTAPRHSPLCVPEFDADTRRRLRRNLVTWYARSGRDLPWRRTADPYRIWISEIMLQQTTVSAVVPYYERFLSRFPDIYALAAARESDVLRYWEGLGYYSRARNIHRTARHLVEFRGGRFPADHAALCALPGIGRYTAGAIASFAFDERAPIVEANTLRLYCRLLGYDGDPRSGAGQGLLWSFAERILPRRSPGRFNQALMELGATTCTPSRPACDRCPLRSCCRSFADGTQSIIPRPKERPRIVEVTEAAVAVHREGRYLLRRRGAGERWAGLWDFPRFPLDEPFDHRLHQTLGRRLQECCGIEAEIGPILTELRHSVTRFRIRLVCYAASCDGSVAERKGGRGGRQRWIDPSHFSRYPLSVTGRKLANFLANQRETDVT